jgi:hypothetical protein
VIIGHESVQWIQPSQDQNQVAGQGVANRETDLMFLSSRSEFLSTFKGSRGICGYVGFSESQFHSAECRDMSTYDAV